VTPVLSFHDEIPRGLLGANVGGGFGQLTAIKGTFRNFNFCVFYIFYIHKQRELVYFVRCI